MTRAAGTVARAVLLGLVLSGCASARWVLVRHEYLPLGVETEIWQHTRTGACERRTYVGSYVYFFAVPCP